MRRAFAAAAALWLAQAGAALALDAPGLLAEWKVAAQSAGATLTYDAEDEGAGGVLVTALKLQSDGPLPFTLSIPELRMESLPDGRVRLVPQSTVTLYWEEWAPLFGTGEIRFFPEGMEVFLLRSGTLTLYSIAAPKLTVEGELPFKMASMSLIRPDAPVENTSGTSHQITTLEGLRQSLMYGGTAGSRILLVQDVDRMTGETSVTVQTPNGVATGTGKAEKKELHSETALILPPHLAWSDLTTPEVWIGLQTSGIEFEAHNRGGAMTSSTVGQSPDLESQAAQMRAFAQDIYAGSKGVHLQAEGHGLHVLLTEKGAPPIDLAMEYGRLALALPLIAPDVQEIDLGMDVEDMTFTPETWASFDPKGALAPLPIDFALHGGLRLRTDLPALITVVQKGGNARFRPEVDNVTLRKLAFNGFGLDLQSDGGLAFDMFKTPPLRSGALHTELKGSQNLIAALEAKGFLEGEMLTGLRFVLSGFFKVAGEDHLTSDIKIEEGLLTLNGVKIGGLENLPFPN